MRRGELWVAAQAVLLAVVAFIPPDLFGLPRLPGWCIPIGITIGLLGGAVGLAGVLRLGPNLTPLPVPKDDATLVDGGIYGVVRHPIYAGLVLAAVGYALIRTGIPNLALALALGVFFDQKARREEGWLIEKFPAYEQYRRRVRGRILPF